MVAFPFAPVEYAQPAHLLGDMKNLKCVHCSVEQVVKPNMLRVGFKAESSGLTCRFCKKPVDFGDCPDDLRPVLSALVKVKPKSKKYSTILRGHFGV